MTTPSHSPRDDWASALAPLHKRAFGLASGLTAGLLIAVFTAVHLWRSPGDPSPLQLLGEYFYGYTVSPSGIAVGFLWVTFVGFVFGWFFAFVRNLVIATTIFIVRTRAELAQTRDFLDHL